MASESVPSKPGSTGTKGFIATLKDWIPLVVALLALLGFALLIWYLLGRITTGEELWRTRAVYLLTGVEAIAFAAAGFVFGTEVHRQRAERAEGARDDGSTGAKEAENRAAVAENRATDVEAAGKALEKLSGPRRKHNQVVLDRSQLSAKKKTCRRRKRTLGNWSAWPIAFFHDIDNGVPQLDPAYSCGKA